MAEDAVDRLYSELSPTEDQFSRSKIFTLLRTRIAIGLDATGRGDESEPIWDQVNGDLEIIANDPSKAFQFAVETLSLDEPADDPDQFRSWPKAMHLLLSRLLQSAHF
jgi:hypothetical protein